MNVRVSVSQVISKCMCSISIIRAKLAAIYRTIIIKTADLTMKVNLSFTIWQKQ